LISLYYRIQGFDEVISLGSYRSKGVSFRKKERRR